jgi:hypothetical protein
MLRNLARTALLAGAASLAAHSWNPRRSHEQTLNDPGVRSGSGVSVLRIHDGQWTLFALLRRSSERLAEKERPPRDGLSR